MVLPLHMENFMKLSCEMIVVIPRLFEFNLSN